MGPGDSPWRGTFNVLAIIGLSFGFGIGIAYAIHKPDAAVPITALFLLLAAGFVFMQWLAERPMRGAHEKSIRKPITAGWIGERLFGAVVGGVFSGSIKLLIAQHERGEPLSPFSLTICVVALMAAIVFIVARSKAKRRSRTVVHSRILGK